ncbi:MAG: hypothetical protein HC822_23855 [Oscillochloris sp.]|nr:hypothetical protein [Oscillochloris sp.]
MIRLIDDPHERTTAATDLLISAVALAEFAALRRRHAHDPRKVDLWGGVFATLAGSGVLGAVAHGLALSERRRRLIWHPLYLALGATVALFAAAAAYDGWGRKVSTRLLGPLLACGLLTYFISHKRNDFRVFLVYEAAAMLCALGIYGNLVRGGRLAGAELMFAGVLITIIAAGVQASGAKATIAGIPFDHNGLFHLVQLAGLPLLGAGLRAALPTTP